jgi:hypothetical protein
MSFSRATFPLLPCVICPSPLFSLGGPFPISSSTHHLPRVLFPPRQSLAKSKPIISRLLPPFACCLPPYVFLCRPSHTSPLLSRPHSFDAITPVMRPILRAGLHAYSSSHSVIPGGSARSLPRPKMLSWPGRPQSP